MPWSPRRAEALAFAFVAVLVIGNSLRMRPRLLGDAAEYFLVAEALWRHGSPDLRPGDREAVWHSLAADGITGAERLAEVPAAAARDGRSYPIHFWGYPLVTLPTRCVFHLLSVSCLKAPQVTNALLLVAALGVATFRSPLTTTARMTLAALSFLSPALWFVAWPHPEVFSFSLTTMALVWRAAGRGRRAILAAAVASVQNPPLVLLALAIWVEVTRAAVRGRGPRGWWAAAGAALALLPAAVPSAFYLLHFGTPSLLTRGAVSLSNLSVRRTLELLFDLNLGLLPYAPVVLCASLWAVLAAGGRNVGWAVLLAMAYLCSATCNWNSGTSGPARYGVWIYPLVLDAFAGLLDRLESGGPPR